jgi:ankyrin repeat protein
VAVNYASLVGVIAGRRWWMNNDWLNELDECGETPLSRVAKSGRMEIARLLFMREIDDTLREVSQLPPLHRAAYWGYEEAVYDLTDAGADPNELDLQGETPLHKAVRLGNVEAARALVERGADIDIPSLLGLTPLHWAALVGHEALAQFLVDCGANIYARDWVTGGMTPLDFARIMRFNNVASLLERRMALL